MTDISGQTEIQLDDDVLEAVVTLLDSIADALDESSDTAITEAERMASEMKGDAGTIPPVYEDIGNTLAKVAKRMKLVNNELTAKLRADARTLVNQMTQQGDVQKTAAEIVNGFDTNLETV